MLYEFNITGHVYKYKMSIHHHQIKLSNSSDPKAKVLHKVSEVMKGSNAPILTSSEFMSLSPEERLENYKIVTNAIKDRWITYRVEKDAPDNTTLKHSVYGKIHVGSMPGIEDLERLSNGKFHKF